MKRLTLRVRDVEFQALDMRARASQVSRSEILRRALNHPPLAIADHRLTDCADALAQHLDTRATGMHAALQALAQTRGASVLDVLSEACFLGLYHLRSAAFTGATADDQPVEGTEG